MNVMVFGALFLFEVHIWQRWYLTGGNSSWSIIRRKKSGHFQIMNKFIMDAQKCKNILLEAALKEFWSSDLKLKKKVCQNSHFFRVILKKMPE